MSWLGIGYFQVVRSVFIFVNFYFDSTGKWSNLTCTHFLVWLNHHHLAILLMGETDSTWKRQFDVGNWWIWVQYIVFYDGIYTKFKWWSLNFWSITAVSTWGFWRIEDYFCHRFSLYSRYEQWPPVWSIPLNHHSYTNEPSWKHRKFQSRTRGPWSLDSKILVFLPN